MGPSPRAKEAGENRPNNRTKANKKHKLRLRRGIPGFCIFIQSFSSYNIYLFELSRNIIVNQIVINVNFFTIFDKLKLKKANRKHESFQSGLT